MCVRWQQGSGAAVWRGDERVGGRGAQEVTCFHTRDANDDWRLELANGGGGELQWGGRLRLVHTQTNHALHSHRHTVPGVNQQEVTAFGGRDDNDLWAIEAVGGVAGAPRPAAAHSGTAIRLVHTQTNHALHSHSINFDHPGSSRQQQGECGGCGG